MGCSCPGWRKETSGEQEAKEGQPGKKTRDWLTNFDLSVMARRCRQTAALFSSWHKHVQLRGSVRTPEGLVKLASFSGQYSEVESALYANALKKALGKLNRLEKEGWELKVNTRLRQMLKDGRTA